jgi:hypothetical protein
MVYGKPCKEMLIKAILNKSIMKLSKRSKMMMMMMMMKNILELQMMKKKKKET